MSRYLSANSGTEVPESLFFVDTETTRHHDRRRAGVFLEKFFLGVVIHCRLRDNVVISREVMPFWDIKHFWNFLYSRLQGRKSNWVFAHNIAFDLQVLNVFDRLLSRELIINESPGDFEIGKPLEEKKRPWKGLCVVDSLPCFIRARSKKGTIVFCDSMNYYPAPLNQLGNQIGVPKLPFPGESGSWEQWVEYCTNDVLIVESLIIETLKLWKSKAAGNWNYTAPGLCWNNFRHDHAPKIIRKNRREACNIVIHDNPEVKELERRSYHGGQMSCFYYGYVSPVKNDFDERPWTNETLYHLDCRSLFPFCMSLAKYPASLQKHIKTGTIAQLEHYCRTSGVIAEVELDTNEIPFIVKIGQEIRYAIGKFWTVLCADELARALEEGVITKVGQIAVYQIGDLFSRYVKYWYNEKESARVGKKSHREAFAKLMLNSLYGKFAQRSPKWIDNLDSGLSVDFGLFYHFPVGAVKPVQLRSFAGNIQQKVESVDAKNSFCAISSFVTSNAREYMRSIREICPKNSIYYQHTDSLICNVKAFEAIKKHGLIGPNMGQFREVCEPAQTAEFWGVGDYEFGSRIVQTGRKSSAKEISPGTITQDSFFGLQSVIARGNPGGVVGQSLTLHRSPERWKRHALENGWAKPFIIDPRLESPSLPPL